MLLGPRVVVYLPPSDELIWSGLRFSSAALVFESRKDIEPDSYLLVNSLCS